MDPYKSRSYQRAQDRKEEIKNLGEMNVRIAQTHEEVERACTEWKYNREEEIKDFHPAAKKFLMDQWEQDLKTRDV